MKTKKITIQDLQKAVNKVSRGKNPEYDEPVPYMPPTKKQIEKQHQKVIKAMEKMLGM